VKFLLNMNVPRALGPMLALEGHDCRHVGDIELGEALDAAIVAEARSRGECVITHDLDYGRLLAFSGDSAPSVVIFRLRRADANLMHARMVSCWNEIETRLASGAVTVIEEAEVRIRRLPIGTGE
jgi:predicted nuclease of predicted toxin-antitoxin system